MTKSDLTADQWMDIFKEEIKSKQGYLSVTRLMIKAAKEIVKLPPILSFYQYHLIDTKLRSHTYYYMSATNPIWKKIAIKKSQTAEKLEEWKNVYENSYTPKKIKNEAFNRIISFTKKKVL